VRVGSTADEDDELRMDDDEIDRIFGDATSGYDTPSIVTVRENNDDADVVDWEYKLPDPPSAFRDDDRSPAMTMFDTVTIGDHLKDVVTLEDEPATDAATAVGLPPAEPNDDRAVEKIIGDRYHCFPQDSGVGSDDSSLPSSCEEKLHADEKPAAAEPKESKLDNFKIVAYDEDRCARPTEIFCDESVKTWKTTQMARESNPAYKSQQTSGAVNRHRSFTADRTNFAVTVKRSTSHISLLSGNIKPSNRLAKHYVGRAYSSERLDHDDDDDDDDASLVKRSFSVDDIAEGELWPSTVLSVNLTCTRYGEMFNPISLFRCPRKQLRGLRTRDDTDQNRTYAGTIFSFAFTSGTQSIYNFRTLYF